MSDPFALISNAASIPWAEVPCLPAEDFVAAMSEALDRKARLCSFFGVPDGGGTCLVAVLAFDADNTLAIGRSAAFSGNFPSLTPDHPQAHLFEREMWEQHELTPVGHP